MDPLRCTVVDAVDPRTSVDLDVHGPAGTTLADAAGPLLEASGLPCGRVLRVEGRDVDLRCPLGERPLVHGVRLVAAPSGDRHSYPVAALRLAVVSGPDAGRELPLVPGHHVLGRSPDATFTVDDPELSRLHLALSVTADGVEIHDLGSSNGTSVDGSVVGVAGARLRPGQRVTAGGSTLVVRLQGDASVRTAPDGAGGLLVRPGGRQPGSPPDVRLDRPPAPEPPARARLPWVAVLAPALLSVPMALLLKQPTYLAFGLLGPVVALATALSDRVGRRRERRSAHARWQADDADIGRQVETALAAELGIRRSASLDPVQLAEAARRPTRDLWRRTSEDDALLDVTVGTGTVPSCVRVRTSGAGGVQPLAHAPAVVRLRDGHLAIAGDRRRADALVRWVVVQLAVLVPPSAVRIVVVVGADEGDGASIPPNDPWLHWVPHVSAAPMPALERELRRRLDAQAGAEVGPRVVVVAPQVERWATDPAFARLMELGPDVGVHVVCTTTASSAVPGGCSSVVTLPVRGAGRLRTNAGQDVHDFVADGVGTAWADRVARALAPLREAGAAGGEGLPSRVLLGPLLDVEADGGLAARWRHRPRSTCAVIGVGPRGPVTVDLVRDGPHALVAGTTGAGKSELLQTLVASLAAVNRPDELAFVLVDYKGGSAFAACAALPHVTGVVTDLDDRLAARALASLQAELTRRERLLAQAAAADLESYQALAGARTDLPRLGRLVIVIDEFRVLAAELPALLDGLVRIAAVGRSLGVHLVLATQRPAGIVSADIRANVNLRICLRVRDRSDSHDVLDAPDAASLPEGLPGRALLRTGSGPMTSVQVALATGPSEPTRAARVVVRPAGAALTTAVTAAPDQLAALARAAAAAADELGVTTQPSPWLVPLPERIGIDQLSGLAPDGPHAIGLVDLPEQGRQPVLRWDPRTASHLGVVGSSRTGRSSALLAVVGAAVLADPQVHVHVVDPGSGPLAGALTGVPQVGTVLTGEQPRAVHRLVTQLTRRLPAHPRGAPTLLAVDGWETVVQQLERVDHGRAVDDFVSLVRDGEAAGLRLVVAGGRALLTSRLMSLVPERLVLRCADPTDLLLAGASTSAVPAHQPPGRALHLPAGHEVQLAWPGDVDEAHRRLAGRPPPTPPPLRLRALPPRICVEELPPASDPRRVRLGVGGDDASPLELDVAGLVAVVGPPGSGRSNVLRLVAEQLHRHGVDVAAVAALDSPVADGPWPVAPDLAPGWLADHPDPVLLVDDADVLPSSAMEHALAAGRTVVVASATSHLAGSWTGWAATLRRTRTGVLLQPTSAHDGEPFGIRAEPPDHRVPGRGQLVVRGVATDLQVALSLEAQQREAAS